MGEARELQLQVIDHEYREATSNQDATITQQATFPGDGARKRWLFVTICALFLVFGQSAGTLLGRFYFIKGGQSTWLGASVQILGFPILLLPLSFYYLPSKDATINCPQTDLPSALTIAFIYVSFGLVMGGTTVMFTYGLLYLPVSTYSLICSTQLAFNALFSFFLNSQKFSPSLFNSLVLVTTSAALLIVGSKSEHSTGISTKKYALGFICTISASAVSSLFLSLSQLVFQKVLKIQTYKTILEMMIVMSLIASSVCLIGLFASGEWKGLKVEMEQFRLGRLSYVMTLVWTAVAWQVSSIGVMGLILEVSALFTNVISTIALPVVPIFAVIFFHDKMDGVKVVALFLAIWGFLSYIYHNHLEDSNSKAAKRNTNDVSNHVCTERA